MSKLNEGVKLRRIHWAAPMDSFFAVGVNAESIVVSMELGQMASVPWALVRDIKGKTHLVNLALCEGVILEDE